jgi:hypothetical protein
MALPRRCKKCQCYVAPQLTRCPRCRKLAPPALAGAKKLTKEERKAERIATRIARDATVPVLRAKHMEWVPSAFAIQCAEQSIEEVKRRIGKTDSARLRNALRSELRLLKATLARAASVNKKRRWTYETFRGKHWSIFVAIGPKGQRYVTAGDDTPADLIVTGRKLLGRRARLQLFEKSKYAKLALRERKEDVVHAKRKSAKKKHRAQKRALKRQRPE